MYLTDTILLLFKDLRRYTIGIFHGIRILFNSAFSFIKIFF